MDAVRLLQGDEWLGHPAHPALVSGPIGAWVFSLVMDGIAAFSRADCAEEAADYAIKAGLASAAVAAVTGLAEYSRLTEDDQVRRKAFTHGVLNATATTLFGANAALRGSTRRSGRRLGILPKLLSVAGVGIIGYTGWLGGQLAYGHGVGVSPGRLEKIRRRERRQQVEPAEEVYQESVEPKANV